MTVFSKTLVALVAGADDVATQLLPNPPGLQAGPDASFHNAIWTNGPGPWDI